MTTHIRRHPGLAALAAFLSAVLCLVACGGGQSVTWLADDLGLDGDRYYVTCEDSTNERHEKEVWLSDADAAKHVEGSACPEGDGLRTEPYTEDESAERKEKNIKSVPLPGKPSSKKPTTSSGASTRPTGPASKTSTGPGRSSSSPKTAPTTTTTNTRVTTTTRKPR